MSPPHPVCGKHGPQPVIGEQLVRDFVRLCARQSGYE